MTTTTTTTPKYERLPDWFGTFCDPNTSRFSLDKPWDHDDGYTYATDGRACVRVWTGLIAEAGRPGPPGEGRRVPGSIGRAYDLDSGGGWEDFPLALPPRDELPPGSIPCPTCLGEPRRRRVLECEWCDGTGTLEGDDGDDETCLECDGKGKWAVRSCDYCSNAGRVPNLERIAVPGRVDGLTLTLGLLHRVLDAGGVLHARSMDAHKSALKFTVGEDFEGRLMPATRDWD